MFPPVFGLMTNCPYVLRDEKKTWIWDTVSTSFYLADAMRFCDSVLRLFFVSRKAPPGSKMTGAEISVAGLRRKVKEEVLYLGSI